MPIGLFYSNTPVKNHQEVELHILKIDEQKYLEIVFPESINEENIEKYFVKTESGNWSRCRFMDRLCTFDKIASISFLLPKNVPLVLIGGPNSSRIEVTINDQKTFIDLKRNQDEFVSIDLDKICNCQKAYNITQINSLFEHVNSQSYWKYASIKFGGKQVTDGFIDINEITHLNLLSEFANKIFNGLLLLITLIIITTIIIWNSWCLGYAFNVAFGLKKVFSNFFFFMIGFSVILLITNSFSYFFSTLYFSKYLAAIIILSSLATTLNLYRATNFNLRAQLSQIDFKYLTLSLITLIIILEPNYIVNNLALGYWQTDVGFYVSVSESLKDKSLIELNSLLGFGHRSMDVAFVSFLSSTFHISTNYSWSTLIGLSSLISAASFASIYSSNIKNSNGKYLAFILGAISPQIIGVYYEGYFSQFIFTCLMWGAAAISLMLLNNNTTAENEKVKYFSIIGLIFSAPIILYHYFAFVVLISFLIVVLIKGITLDKLKTHLHNLLIFGASIILFSNIGLFSLAPMHALETDLSFLNAIAKNIVFPFIDSLKIFVIFAGFLPFHSNPTFAKSFTDTGSNLFDNIYSWFNLLSNPLMGYYGVFILILPIIISVIIICKNKLRSISYDALFLVVFSLLTSATVALLYSQKQWYIFGKLLWLYSSIIPLVTLITISKIWNTNSITIKIFLQPLLIISLLLTLFSGYLSSIFWFSSLSPARAPHSSNHIYSESIIKKIENASGDYTFLTEKERNDSELVLASIISSHLKSQKFKCTNCLYRSTGEFFWIDSSASSSDAINLSNCTSFKVKC